MRSKSLVEMSMKCQGKLDICQGKVREMSGNFDIAGAWEPCHKDMNFYVAVYGL